MQSPAVTELGVLPKRRPSKSPANEALSAAVIGVDIGNSTTSLDSTMSRTQQFRTLNATCQCGAIDRGIFMSEHQDAFRFLARRNEWESRFFEREIWTLSRDPASDRTALEHIKAHPDVHLWECRASLSEQAHIQELIACGFYLCDTSCDFVFDLSGCNSAASFPIFSEGIHACLASQDDVPQLEKLIAERGFQTRFERTPFGPSDSTKFYSAWARNAVLGAYDDLCGILRYEDELVGFVTLRDIAQYDARIGLIATSARHKRLGVGEWLWTYAAHLALQRGKQRLHMATQMGNRNAIALCLKQKGQLSLTSAHFYHARNVSRSNVR